MVQILKNCFFIIKNKNKMDAKMKSFSDDVKNYYTFTTIKHILDDIHLKNQDITSEINRYSSYIVLYPIPAKDTHVSKDEIKREIRIPYPSQFENRATKILNRPENRQQDVVRYRDARIRAERSVQGYQDIINQYVVQKKYLYRLQKLYDTQLQDIELLFTSLVYTDSDYSENDNSYSPTRACYSP